MQPFVVPPACSPRPPLIRLNKAVLPPHRHFSDAPITLLRNYINAKIPVADAHFIPFCIFPSISPKPVSRPRPAVFIQQHWDGRLFTASAETCESCEGWVLVHKESSPLSSPPILPMKLFTLSAYNFIANHTEDLVRYIRMLKNVFITISVHPPTHSGHPLLSEPNGPPPKLDLFVALCCPLQEKRWRYKHAKVKRKRRYSCQPADFAADSALREADERAVALDAAVAVLSEPEQILVNTEELVKTGNSRHAIGLTRHRPRLATAARLHLHPLAARLLRRTPAARRKDFDPALPFDASLLSTGDIETIATL
ncbi:hypothetical protein BLNAU_25024 [Blattamonas nauphoetae]|uniref:Uncharacterized protein n=1 Tax=Blattamonas nauphoetae TaxID=2049346 RepID=A0ABQ9WMS3_9EUKA|nr:hypothetical protein BLNAU_25024 [Blattamonas nauphoetae]